MCTINGMTFRAPPCVCMCRCIYIYMCVCVCVCVMTRNRRPNYAKRLRTRRLFTDGVQHGNNLSREQRIEDGSGFNNFVRMTNTDLEIPLQKKRLQNSGERYKISRSNSSIRSAVTLIYSQWRFFPQLR